MRIQSDTMENTLKRPHVVVYHSDEDSDEKKSKIPKIYPHLATASTVDSRSKFLQSRKSLPVYIFRKGLMQEIAQHENVIIIGDTGSGKTTQLPQLLLQAGMAGKSACIGITQPRRIAAISVARRVAQEQGAKLGKLVGYHVRFEDCTSRCTKIKFLTDGMMVREAMTDEILSNYSIIILDEAHERSVQTDILFGVTKRAQHLRKLKKLPPLKLIIMSATMDPTRFKEYFKAHAIYVAGRQHPLRIFHTTSTEEDYAFASLVTAFKIHREQPANEDILIFLTGQEEIEAVAKVAREVLKQLEGEGYPPLDILPLYSALPIRQQLEAFKRSAPGMRKLVLSTNIAETSVTINGICYVIDSGVVKVRTHHPMTGLYKLKVEKISQTQASQRSGRAAREAPGKCYRMYTIKEFENMKEMPTPEIQRCSFTATALQLLAIGIDISTFDFMDKPPQQNMDVAMRCLKKLGAIKGSPIELTKLGKMMSLFPLDPVFTKVILAAVEHKCLEEALSVIALLSTESIFMTPSSKKQEAYNAHLQFSSSEGDHVMLLKVFRAYKNATNKKVWCHQNFINHRNIEYGMKVRQQLATLAQRANLEKMSCGTDTEQLRRAFFDALFDNLVELQRNDKTYVMIHTRQPVTIHPSSTLSGLPKARLLLFTELIATGKFYIRGLSVVNPSWLEMKNRN